MGLENISIFSWESLALRFFELHGGEDSTQKTPVGILEGCQDQKLFNIDDVSGATILEWWCCTSLAIHSAAVKCFIAD
jgi:hypothetical protein